MVNLCRDAGLPEPDFSERTGGFVVTFYFKSPISSYVTDTDIDMAAASLNKQQEEILNLIKKSGSVSTQDLLVQLEDPPTQRTIQKDLRHLKESGLIEVKGAAKELDPVSPALS